MRGARMLGASVVGLLVAGGLVTAGPAPGASADGGPPPPVPVTAPVQVVMKIRSTPIEGGYSNYCAIGAFVPFNDLAGYVPASRTVTYFNSPSTVPIGPAPYSDGAAINGLVFPPSGFAHQVQLGDFTYSQGGGDPAAFAQDCEATRVRVDGFFGDTATVTYTPTEACTNAATALAAAEKKVDKAKKKLKKASRAERPAAQAALKKAKAKAKKAKKAYQAACG